MPEVKYRITVEGAAQARAAVKGVSEEASAGESKLAMHAGTVSNAFKGISRDIDAVAGESASKFGRMASDILGVAESVGSGGLGAAVALATAAYGFFNTILDENKKQQEAISKHESERNASLESWRTRVDEIKKAYGDLATKIEDASESDIRTSIFAVSRAMEEQESIVLRMSSSRDKDDKLRKESAEQALIQLGRQKDALEEQQKLNNREKSDRDSMAEYEKQAAIQEFLRKDKKDKDEQMGQEEISRRFATVTELRKINTDDAAFERRSRKSRYDQELSDIASQNAAKEEAYDFWAKHNAAIERNVQDTKTAIASEGEQTRITMAQDALDAQEQLAGKTLVKERIAFIRNNEMRAASAERESARIAAARKMEEGGDGIEAEIAADNALTEAKIANRHAVAEATIAALRRQEDAQRAATAGEYAQMAATEAMTPVVGALNEKIGQLGELNRENAADFTDFSHEIPELAAKMAQGVLAGIAIQAVGKSAFEAAEAIGATASGFVALATPGGQASAVGYFKGAAMHAASAAAYGALAGGAAVGAGAIGMSRGEGGLIGLTSAERKANNDKKNAANGSGGRTAGGGFGGSGGQGGGDVITVYNYEPGSVDASDRQQRNRTIQAANRDNARDVFAQREMRRSA